MTRLIALLALALIFAGLAVVAVGVHMLSGLPSGMIAYGAATVLTGVAVAALWA